MYNVWVITTILTLVIMIIVIVLITNEIYDSPNWEADDRFCNVTITGFKRSFGNSNSFIIRGNNEESLQQITGIHGGLTQQECVYYVRSQMLGQMIPNFMF